MQLNIPTRTDSHLQTNLTQTLTRRQSAGQGVRLFVYGLLAANPPFPFTSVTPVTLNSHHRSFNLYDPMNRGTPAKPGLTLGLQPGGLCHGLSYHIAEENLIPALTKVWQQEMRLPFYTPTWLNIEDEETLVMLTDPTSPALTSPLSLLEISRIIATSQGEAGTNLEYLTLVAQAFASHDITDTAWQSVQQTLASQHAA